MKHIIIATLLFYWLTIPVSGQVRFNLSYQPDTKKYTVSIAPQKTWSAPMNKTGSGQIILRVASDVAFVPAITSHVEGIIWADNAYIENPKQAPGSTFVAIAMVNGPTDKINFTEGVEFPLFSFVNAAGGCPGLIELTANDDPVIQSVITAGFNVTQHLAVLGARGNAYAGIGQGKVDCGLVSGIDETGENGFENIRVMPLPADEQVTVYWNRVNDNQGAVQLVVFNMAGQEIYRNEAPASKGESFQTIIVKNWKSGLYQLAFQNKEGRLSMPRNLIVAH